MKENFELRIESMHLADDRGSSENVHRLDEELLRKRKVVFIDIADERLRPKHGGEDLGKFRSGRRKSLLPALRDDLLDDLDLESGRISKHGRRAGSAQCEVRDHQA